MSVRNLLSLMMEPHPMRWVDPWRHALRSLEHDFHPYQNTLRTPYLLNKYLKDMEKDLETVKTLDDNGFQFQVDVKHYKPEEISVKLEDNIVVVEGKHEEVSDEHGTISRQFVRKFGLPEGVVNVDKLQSSLSSDGVLTITAPKLEALESKTRSIPIEKTGPVKDALKQSEAKE